jgi:hypothetical protein
MVPLDCRVGTLSLLAMTKVEGLPPKDGNGRGGSSQFSDASPKAVIASPQDAAIQSEALCGKLGRCDGMPNGSAGLPRRFRSSQ